MASSLRPEFGPTLPELLAPRWRGLGVVPRRALVVAALAVAALAALALRAAVGGDQEFVHRQAPTFNLRYPDALKRLAPRPGDYLRLESTRNGLFLQSFAVRQLHLPAYRGAPDGEFPFFAESYIASLARQLKGFQRACDGCGEGKARINEVPGYSINFQAKLGNRTLYGRDVMLVNGGPGTRDGVILEMRATPAAKVAGPETVGSGGVLKLPLRSFRFGT
ncbi:MAG: hypothetical protein QOI98_2027 [Solirubrobacteraceae bacterium]|jgi:hypothetical protein|nr:hypothetical protein [Solirubrobacteraceae bacterium]